MEKEKRKKHEESEHLMGRVKKERKKPNTDKYFMIIPRVSPALTSQHIKSMT